MPGDDWYINMIGASFDMHPPAELGIIVPEKPSQEHYILSCCGGRENWLDEWYNFHKHPRDNTNLQILLKGDVNSFAGGKHGDDHPLAWCQEFDGGRVYFTALGHFEEAYEDEWFVGQIERGLLWAARRDGSKR
jgi:type 1 glutamine amidotransferase